MSLTITTVYVTHDQEEAMAISDRIAIMNAGRIVQIGTAEELYQRPSSAFAATFLGEANLIKCRIVEVAMDLLTLGIGDISWAISSAVRGSVGDTVEAVVRPEAIKLSTTGKGFSGKVVSATYLGSKVDYLVRVGDQSLAGRAIRSGHRIALRRRRDRGCCAAARRRASSRQDGSINRRYTYACSR